MAPLVALLAEPLPTTDLVLVWERGAASTRLGAIPKSLKDAVKERVLCHNAKEFLGLSS